MMLFRLSMPFFPIEYAAMSPPCPIWSNAVLTVRGHPFATGQLFNESGTYPYLLWCKGWIQFSRIHFSLITIKSIISKTLNGNTTLVFNAELEHSLRTANTKGTQSHVFTDLYFLPNLINLYPSSMGERFW